MTRRTSTPSLSFRLVNGEVVTDFKVEQEFFEAIRDLVLHNDKVTVLFTREYLRRGETRLTARCV